MVCGRAKTHFDPTEQLKFDNSTAVSGSTNLEVYKDGYMPLHANQQKAMYFAVRSRLLRRLVSDLTVFSIVTLTTDNCHNRPVHLIFYEFLWRTLVLYTFKSSFSIPCFRSPCGFMPTIWLALTLTSYGFYLSEVAETYFLLIYHPHPQRSSSLNNLWRVSKCSLSTSLPVSFMEKKRYSRLHIGYMRGCGPLTVKSCFVGLSLVRGL
jgi:hypothetical protein